jgi:hypothetical protein
MKQLLSLFLFLLPCLAWAQYPSNGNQKITLGEQTTADGLIYRGLAADTTRKPSVDTMAYIILDTATNIQWHYKKATSNAWLRVGGSITSGLTGVLPLANGGTGSATQNFVDLTNTQTVGGSKTFTSAVTATRFNPNSSTATGTGMYLPAANTLGFSTNGTEKMSLTATGNLGLGVTPSAWYTNFGTKAIQFAESGSVYGLDVSSSDRRAGLMNNAFINSSGNYIYINTGHSTQYEQNAGKHTWFTAPSATAGDNITFTEVMTINSSGNLGINQPTPTQKLHVVGNARITGAYDVTTGSAANVFVTSDGVLQRSTSSIKYKSDVENYTKGLNEVMKLRPVTYKSINSNSDKIYAGFIAEELADLKLTELYENNDYGEPDAISYAYMVTLLTKAIQDQQEQITLLKKRLLILENK